MLLYVYSARQQPYNTAKIPYPNIGERCTLFYANLFKNLQIPFVTKCNTKTHASPPEKTNILPLNIPLSKHCLNCFPLPSPTLYTYIRNC